ncbi:hypothetical protein [Enterobacter hormaechei]|uniref:hypothetical protein n=1 Tax=Enterobacter hormaechei TaxID=158836 RepID=UPI002A75F3BC|nr:hypothetical protein [Enterobacter hormaechei]MDY3572317.1 hypothetical protein [Enterobacter hormaechei]
MNKPELIAELNTLSGQLERQLSTEGSKSELEARLSEARVELSMLGDETDDDTVTAGDVVTVTATAMPSGPQSDTREERSVTHIRILLRVTVDVWHYRQEAGKPRQTQVKRVCEVVPAGRVVVVDAEDAELLIDNHYAEAV